MKAFQTPTPPNTHAGRTVLINVVCISIFIATTSYTLFFYWISLFQFHRKKRSEIHFKNVDIQVTLISSHKTAIWLFLLRIDLLHFEVILRLTRIMMYHRVLSKSFSKWKWVDDIVLKSEDSNLASPLELDVLVHVEEEHEHEVHGHSWENMPHLQVKVNI